MKLSKTSEMPTNPPIAFGKLLPSLEDKTNQERGSLLTLAYHALSVTIAALPFMVVMLTPLSFVGTLLPMTSAHALTKERFILYMVRLRYVS